MEGPPISSLKARTLRDPGPRLLTRSEKDLEDTAAINIRIDQLNEKVKDQAKSYIILKKERDEQVMIN